MDVMQRWIAQRITSLLGFEDDIVVGTCVNYLSEEVSVRNEQSDVQRNDLSKLYARHTYRIFTRSTVNGANGGLNDHKKMLPTICSPKNPAKKTAACSPQNIICI